MTAVMEQYLRDYPSVEPGRARRIADIEIRFGALSKANRAMLPFYLFGYCQRDLLGVVKGREAGEVLVAALEGFLSQSFVQADLEGGEA